MGWCQNRALRRPARLAGLGYHLDVGGIEIREGPGLAVSTKNPTVSN
jgi:hypothetical protein